MRSSEISCRSFLLIWREMWWCYRLILQIKLKSKEVLNEGKKIVSPWDFSLAVYVAGKKLEKPENMNWSRKVLRGREEEIETRWCYFRMGCSKSDVTEQFEDCQLYSRIYMRNLNSKTTWWNWEISSKFIQQC